MKAAFVTPAKAGVHGAVRALRQTWIPAFAGMTQQKGFAGMTRQNMPG